MKKYIGLISGIILVFISLLFYGRQQGTYNLLIICGLLLALISFIIILVSKITIKIKLVWSGIVIFSAIIQQFAEPILIDCSYRIYLNQNSRDISEINRTLLNIKGDISILKDTIIDKNDLLTIDEKTKLSNLRRKIKTYMIIGSNDQIYYGLWGFLDVRLGLTYLVNDSIPHGHLRHLKDKWYH